MRYHFAIHNIYIYIYIILLLCSEFGRNEHARYALPVLLANGKKTAVYTEQVRWGTIT
jgi:hypothetical protein